MKSLNPNHEVPIIMTFVPSHPLFAFYEPSKMHLGGFLPQICRNGIHNCTAAETREVSAALVPFQRL